MSWQGSTTIPAGSTPDQINQVLADLDIQVGPQAPTETEQQIAAAKEGAKQLLCSGAFGHRAMLDGHHYRVQLSGHANPGHEPVPGWNDDFVSVTVAQIGPPQEG